MDEFLSEVIKGLNEKYPDCSITRADVKKNNGIVRTGITIKPADSNMAPTIYVDEYYENNLPVLDTIKTVSEIYDKAKMPSLDLEWFQSFESVKPCLRARLLNQSTDAEVSVSAEEYGFKDLIIIPVVDVKDIGVIRVLSEHLKYWNKSAEELVRIALENTKQDVEMLSLMKETGAPDALCRIDPTRVLSTQDKEYGAIAVILLKEELHNAFPNGYMVIPSSVHEVIVAPDTEALRECYTDEMVKTVNKNNVKLEDRLSNHIYHFE